MSDWATCTLTLSRRTLEGFVPGPWGRKGRVPILPGWLFLAVSEQVLPQSQNEVRLSLQGDTNNSFPFSVCTNSGPPHHRYKRC